MDFAEPAMPSLPFHASPPAVPESLPSDAEMTRAMVERIIRLDPKSGAEALRQLRATFPDAPLALRVAALGILMRRRNHGGPRAA
jgi:hypothetical protein